MSDLNIAVVGAGVVGLTTALEIQKQLHGAQVTILAEKFDEDTTSYVAAGFFRPGTSFTGPTVDITRQWINDAYHYWDDIRTKEYGSEAGVMQISGYIFSSLYPSITRNPYIEKLVPLYRNVQEEELKICPGNWKYGSFFTTLLTECRLFLPWAKQKVLENGGKIVSKRIDNFSELVGKFDVVANCTGLNAKFLCNDYKLVPMRGQVLKVRAPWLKTFFYGDYDTYIIPGFETVTLGGCRQYDSFDTSISKYDGLAIKERCESLVPSLKHAPIVAQRVGLRPHRDPVRVEKEILDFDAGRLKIVHNYGHGGYGVTTAPGTAIHAVKLVKELLSGNSKL